MPSVAYSKYHALENDFLVLQPGRRALTRAAAGRLARKICHRRTGVGADGIVLLTASRKAHARFEIYNADGSWAEKSGNGLRIAAAHLSRQSRRRRFDFETATSIDTVKVTKRLASDYTVTASLGEPEFRARLIPVKSPHEFHINLPLRFGDVKLPATCLSVGNPHIVILVADFDFDWQALGADIEWSEHFPHGTNVEFVQPITRRRIRVADWERGAGATGSSGTGAAAAVCALVLMGIVDRSCTVQFETGNLRIHWYRTTNLIELTGPVTAVASGRFEF